LQSLQGEADEQRRGPVHRAPLPERVENVGELDRVRRLLKADRVAPALAFHVFGGEREAVREVMNLAQAHRRFLQQPMQDRARVHVVAKPRGEDLGMADRAVLAVMPAHIFPAQRTTQWAKLDPAPTPPTAPSFPVDAPPTAAT